MEKRQSYISQSHKKLPQLSFLHRFKNDKGVSSKVESKQAQLKQVPFAKKKSTKDSSNTTPIKHTPSAKPAVMSGLKTVQRAQVRLGTRESENFSEVEFNPQEESKEFVPLQTASVNDLSF